MSPKPATQGLLLLHLLHLLQLLQNLSFCSATDTLQIGDTLTPTKTLVSNTGIFELGFFSLSKSSPNLYLGIWYKHLPVLTPVWTANQNSPLRPDPPPVLLLSSSCVLQLLSPPSPPLSVSADHSITAARAVLLDSGNLVLTNATGHRLWQSFHHLTDTWLPGAPLGSENSPSRKSVLTSADGDYSFGMDRENEYMTMLWRGRRSYWGGLQGVADDVAFDPRDAFNMSLVSNTDGKYYSYVVENNSSLMRYVITPEGKVERMVWDATITSWVSFWTQPVETCDVFAACGGFGVCTDSRADRCTCLPGFRRRIGSKGCEKNTSVVGDGGGFLRVEGVGIPAFGRSVESGEKECVYGCMGSKNCSGYAVVRNGVCWEWEGELLNLKEVGNMSGGKGGDFFYVKISSSFHHGYFSSHKGYKKWVVVVLGVLGMFVGVICLGFRLWRTFMAKGEDLVLFETTNVLNAKNDGEKTKEECLHLPMFSLKSVLTATDNFSDDNKLGEGGFGIVYKGKLRSGEQVAVKRLSSGSGQGITELRTEAVLIARLQHKNLVSLLGCCLEHGEKILIYEYLENKSLDIFLFNSAKRVILDWKTRVSIIEGLSQGLLYLHEYSRLRIIHRDLKASNILLDSHMNPKISDFGMARIFATTSSESTTDRIVGTYGYMSPEYAMDGVFSVKSDVFSFGILLLEIISGKRNRRTPHEDCQNLVGYAWELWKAERGDEFVELQPSSATKLRYVHVGLLCVQENPNDRPTMSDVVSMLTNELTLLSPPKQPLFSFMREDSIAPGSGYRRDEESNSRSYESTSATTTSHSVEFQSFPAV